MVCVSHRPKIRAIPERKKLTQAPKTGFVLANHSLDQRKYPVMFVQGGFPGFIVGKDTCQIRVKLFAVVHMYGMGQLVDYHVVYFIERKADELPAV